MLIVRAAWSLYCQFEAFFQDLWLYRAVEIKSSTD